MALTLTPATSGTPDVPFALPAASKGQGYACFLGATGGTGALSWSLRHGKLPAGLSLSTDGRISGTALFNGTPAPFTLEVQDSSSPPQVTYQQYQLTAS